MSTWQNISKNAASFSNNLKAVGAWLVEYLATQDLDYLMTEGGDYLITGVGTTYDPAVSAFANATKTNAGIGYLLTDAFDFILAGLNSDEVLIINDAQGWANTQKT